MCSRGGPVRARVSVRGGPVRVRGSPLEGIRSGHASPLERPGQGAVSPPLRTRPHGACLGPALGPLDAPCCPQQRCLGSSPPRTFRVGSFFSMNRSAS